MCQEAMGVICSAGGKPLRAVEAEWTVLTIICQAQPAGRRKEATPAISGGIRNHRDVELEMPRAVEDEEILVAARPREHVSQEVGIPGRECPVPPLEW